MLCYVDASRVEGAKSKDEYVRRINMGIRNARRKGMPEAFVDKYLRPFIQAGGVADRRGIQDIYRKGRRDCYGLTPLHKLLLSTRLI